MNTYPMMFSNLLLRNLKNTRIVEAGGDIVLDFC